MATNNSTNTSNPITVPQGGTGDSSLTAYSVICGGTTSTGSVQSVSSVGSSGQILTSNGAGALPSFKNLASGQTLLQSSTASASASIDFTGLSSSAYTHYNLVYNFITASSATTLTFLVSTNNGSTWISASYLTGGWNTPVNSTTVTNSTTAASGYLSTATNNTTSWAGQAFFFNLSNGSAFLSIGEAVNTAGNRCEFNSYNPAVNVNAIRIIATSGNIASGSFSLYGINK